MKQGQFSHLTRSLVLPKQDCTCTDWCHVLCHRALEMKACTLSKKHSVGWFILLTWMKELEWGRERKKYMQNNKVYFWCILQKQKILFFLFFPKTEYVILFLSWFLHQCFLQDRNPSWDRRFCTQDGAVFYTFLGGYYSCKWLKNKVLKYGVAMERINTEKNTFLK